MVAECTWLKSQPVSSLLTQLKSELDKGAGAKINEGFKIFTK
jgi:hypothetical protein